MSGAKRRPPPWERGRPPTPLEEDADRPPLLSLARSPVQRDRRRAQETLELAQETPLPSLALMRHRECPCRAGGWRARTTWRRVTPHSEKGLVLQKAVADRAHYQPFVWLTFRGGFASDEGRGTMDRRPLLGGLGARLKKEDLLRERDPPMLLVHRYVHLRSYQYCSTGQRSRKEHILPPDSGSLTMDDDE